MNRLQKLKKFFERARSMPVRIESIERSSSREFARAVYVGENQLLVRLFTRQLIYVDGRDTSLAPHLMAEGVWEFETTELWLQLVKSAPVVFDVGANFGYYGIIAATRTPTGVIHFFEANPDLVLLIEKSCWAAGLRQRSHVVQAAISDVSGKQVTLYRPRAFWGGARVLFESQGITPDAPGIKHEAHSMYAIDREFQVETLSLDEYCAANKIERVDVLKIDVEGSEERVYAGMQRLIARNPHVKILMEYTLGEYSEAFFSRLVSDFAFIRTRNQRGELVQVKSEPELRQVLGVGGVLTMLLLENERTVW